MNLSKDTLKQRIDKVVSVLKENDIEMVIRGCGCCMSPIVAMKYKGETVVEATGDLDIKMFEVDWDHFDDVKYDVEYE